MIVSRRAMILGATTMVATPDISWAAKALFVASDWSLATADVEADVPPRALRLVRGRAPADLAGSLYRNGPAKFRRPGRSAGHWFDGDGLIRRFHIEDGKATLAARFADTPKRRQEERMGAMLLPGFGTSVDPRAELGGPDDANASNTSVMPVGDKVWSLWENGSPMAMDGVTLQSEGFVTLRPDLKGMPFSAHPRIEPDGRIWNLGISGKKAMVWRLSAAGALEAAELVDLPRASYLHDFWLGTRAFSGVSAVTSMTVTFVRAISPLLPLRRLWGAAQALKTRRDRTAKTRTMQLPLTCERARRTGSH